MESYWQADVVANPEIPVSKARLPEFDHIAGYLRRIDANRWYSNGGPLAREFEARLAARAGAGPECVTTVANGTIGLTLALEALEPPAGTLCMVPAWTFAATAHAIRLAGVVPWIVDVDRETWALEPSLAEALLPHAPGDVSVVLPVAPFGHPVDPAPWERFRERTGVAVLLDAAAAFDTIEASSIPAVVSLHATKIIGVGEGGYVVSTDAAFVRDVQRRANFGFRGSREARVAGTNGKISEYTAAVGLAALDIYPSTRSDFMRVGADYRRGLAGKNDVFIQDGFAEDWIASTISVSAPATGAETITLSLANNGIGSRRWWGGGLHRHAAFQSFPRGSTENTDQLVDSVIGLPFWPDLPADEVARICDIVLESAR